MDKIASPTELQAELRSLMAYIQGHGPEGRPDRQVLASKLSDLADRVAAVKLPKNTVIKDVHGLRLSSWGGHYALVTTSNEYYSGEFDPEKMARKFSVIPVLDQYTGRPVPAEPRFLGSKPVIHDSSVPYSKATGIIGPKIGGIPIRFGKTATYWISVPLKDLYPRESGDLERLLISKGYFDVYAVRSKMTKASWAKVLKMTFEEAQEMPMDMADAVDEVVTKILGRYAKDSSEEERTWASVKGIFAVARNGKIKYVVGR